MQDSDPEIRLVPKREGPGRRRSDEGRSWQQAAPRWMLLVTITVLLFACGFLWGRAENAESRESANLRAAVEDSRNKGDQRTLERVAVAEEQIRAIIEENRENKAAIKQLTVALAENTSQLRLLTVQLKRAQ